MILSFAESEKIKFTLIKDGRIPYYQRAYFDAVLLLDVIEHWHNSPRELLNTLIKYLKPGGYLFVGMPNSVNIRKRISVVMGKTNYCSLESFYFCGEPWRGHVREYTQTETEQLVKYQGLNIVHSFCINTMINKHNILKNNYLKLIYKILTNIFPRWRDSILVVGQKPEYWKPVLYNPEKAAKYIKRPVISRTI